jgi:ATP-dependent Lon protease
LLVAQRSAAKDEPSPEDLYRIGCVANILQMLKLPDGTVKVLVEGTQRATVEDIVDIKTLFMAQITTVPRSSRPRTR